MSQSVNLYLGCTKEGALLRLTFTVDGKPRRLIRCWSRPALTASVLVATVWTLLRELTYPEAIDLRATIVSHATRMGEMYAALEPLDAALYSITVAL